MSGEIVMETERLILRNYRAEDVAAYVALSADPEVMRYIGGVRSAERSAAEVAELQDAYVQRGWAILAVERKSDGAFIGISGLSVERWYPDDIQIGWRLFRQYWGQGYATEAAAMWRDRGVRDARRAPADLNFGRSQCAQSPADAAARHEP